MEAVYEVVRRESKFALNLMEQAMLRHRLDAVLQRDSNSEGNDGYLVRSLYFDTGAKDDYQDKADGLLLRKKVRLRIYDPKGQEAKLELKQKEGLNQRKRSLRMTKDQAQCLQRGEYGCLAQLSHPFAQYMFGLMTSMNYRPACIVEYDRLAYTATFNNTRVTIDGGLRASYSHFDLFDEALILTPVQSPLQSTLEVKFDNFLPSYVKDLLETHERPHVSLSKYYIARSFLNGGDN